MDIAQLSSSALVLLVRIKAYGITAKNAVDSNPVVAYDIDMKPTSEVPKVCFPFVGESVGGSHVSTVLLIRELIERGQTPVVVLAQADGPLAAYLRDHNIAFTHLAFTPLVEGSFVRECWQVVCSTWRLATFMRRHGIDVVHTNDIRMHWQWGFPARLVGVKHVWHQRTVNPSRRNALFARTAHRVLTISRFCKQALPQSTRQKTEVVYNPFACIVSDTDESQHRQALRERLGVGHDTPVVTFVGNLAEQKRPKVFIEMANLVKKTFAKDIKFAMIGAKRPEYTEVVEAQINALGMQDDIDLLGPRFPIEPWLAGSDVVVAPGVNEGFGRTLVESMLSRTPVVASDDAGHREIIDPGRSGFLVARDQPDVFADKVSELLVSDALCTQVVAKAFDDARQKFSLEQHVGRVVACYQELCCE